VRLAIAAILNQTFRHYEFLISDNCSTDRTQQICEEYARRDPRIRYFRQPRNLGSAPNHNLLVNHARGEYFMWVMHDDLYAPTVIERCVEVLDQYPDVAVAYAKMITIDGEGREIEPVEIDAHTVEAAPHRRFAHCILAGNSVHSRQGLLRLSSLRGTMLNLPFRASDHPLVAELALLGKIHEVPEHLYFKRVHPGTSLSANADPVMLSRWFDTSGVPVRRWYRVAMYTAFVNAVLRHRELGWREQVRSLLALQRWPLQQLRNVAGLYKRALLRPFRPVAAVRSER